MKKLAIIGAAILSVIAGLFLFLGGNKSEKQKVSDLSITQSSTQKDGSIKEQSIDSETEDEDNDDTTSIETNKDTDNESGETTLIVDANSSDDGDSDLNRGGSNASISVQNYLEPSVQTEKFLHGDSRDTLIPEIESDDYYIDRIKRNSTITNPDVSKREQFELFWRDVEEDTAEITQILRTMESTSDSYLNMLMYEMNENLFSHANTDFLTIYSYIEDARIDSNSIMIEQKDSGQYKVEAYIINSEGKQVAFMTTNMNKSFTKATGTSCFWLKDGHMIRQSIPTYGAPQY